MFDPESWHEATVVDRKVWDDGLFTSTLDVSRDFEAGQFATLGLVVDGEAVKRAYSVASAPGRPLEFFIVQVEGGRLSPRLWALEPGQRVFVRDRIAGLFTLRDTEDGGTLWLVSTGTGLAPYISMLRQGDVLRRFDRIVVVHGVRHASQLAYRDELLGHDPARVTYVPCASREDAPGCLRGRITSLLEDGSLEAAVDDRIVTERHHVMLCGNPDMVVDTVALLQARGLVVRKPRKPGQIHLERYW